MITSLTMAIVSVGVATLNRIGIAPATSGDRSRWLPPCRSHSGTMVHRSASPPPGSRTTLQYRAGPLLPIAHARADSEVVGSRLLTL